MGNAMPSLARNQALCLVFFWSVVARTLVAASENFLELASPILTAAPLTLACWYRPVAVNVDYILMLLGAADTTANYFSMYHFSGNNVVAQTGGPSDATFAISSTGTSADVWTHACAVFAGDDLRCAYVNGASKGSDPTSKVPDGINRTLLGARYVSPGVKNLFLNGDIAEAAIWNAALTDDQVASLVVAPGVGIYPSDVRPESLAAYWRLLGDDSPEPDEIGSNDLTVSGAVQGSHLTMLSLSAAFQLMGQASY